MELPLIIGSLVSAAPGLVVWIVALILSIVLRKRSGGKLERLLVVGSSLMLVSTILGIPKPAIADVLSRSSLSNVSAAAVVSSITLVLGLIGLAGAICLFYAIWKKFNEKTANN